MNVVVAVGETLATVCVSAEEVEPVAVTVVVRRAEGDVVSEKEPDCDGRTDSVIDVLRELDTTTVVEWVQVLERCCVLVAVCDALGMMRTAQTRRRLQ